MGIVERYLRQLNSRKRRWRRAAAILTVLCRTAIAVLFCLRMTAAMMCPGLFVGCTVSADGRQYKTDHRTNGKAQRRYYGHLSARDCKAEEKQKQTEHRTAEDTRNQTAEGRLLCGQNPADKGDGKRNQCGGKWSISTRILR